MAAARRPFRRELCADVRGKIPKYSTVPGKSFCTVVVVRPDCEIESYCTPSTLLCSQPTEQPTAERKVQEVEDEYNHAASGESLVRHREMLPTIVKNTDETPRRPPPPRRPLGCLPRVTVLPRSSRARRWTAYRLRRVPLRYALSATCATLAPTVTVGP